MRGLIVVLRRAGLRIHEALAVTEADLDARRGAVLVRRGKGGRRRKVGMDDWSATCRRAPVANGSASSFSRSTCSARPWQQLQQWLDLRIELPVGPLFCILTGPTRGRGWSP